MDNVGDLTTSTKMYNATHTKSSSSHFLCYNYLSGTNITFVSDAPSSQENMDLDTLKSVAIGSTGITVQFLDMLPEMVRVGVGIITIIYFGYKIALIRKELNK